MTRIFPRRQRRVTAVSIAEDLPTVWVRADSATPVAAAIDGLTGCSALHASPLAGHGRNPGEHFLLVYFGEAATAADAAMVAEAASHGGRPGSVVMGSHAGRLCAVLVATCVMAGQPSFENTRALARFGPLIAAQLA